MLEDIIASVAKCVEYLFLYKSTPIHFAAPSGAEKVRLHEYLCSSGAVRADVKRKYAVRGERVEIRSAYIDATERSHRTLANVDETVRNELRPERARLHQRQMRNRARLRRSRLSSAERAIDLQSHASLPMADTNQI